MAITSVGYDGTVDEVQWASMVPKVGGYEYGIDGAGHFAVSQSAGTRMISVAPGLAWGRGVMDISDAAAVIQLEAVTTGSRYDMIALRRSWGPANGGPTEIVVVKGTSAKAIPSGRKVNPGVEDDQPIALVRVQAGSASIPEIIDLRVWGRNGGQLYAKDDLARSYLGSVGTEVNVAGMLWQYISGDNNVATWQKVGPRADTGWVSVTSGSASGWKVSYIKYRIKDGMCQLQIRAQRTGSSITAIPGDGDLDNSLVKICTVPSAAKPKSAWAPLQSGIVGPLISGALQTDGGVFITAVPPGLTIKKDFEYTLCSTYFLD